MRKVVASAFLSLDGIMQAPGGPEEDTTGGFTYGGWTVHYSDASTGAFMGEIFSEPFDLLLGRNTYDIFAAHWPYTAEDNFIAKLFNGAIKHVVTSSPEPLEWVNSVALKGDPIDEIKKLKNSTGPDLLVQGSSVLIRTLLAHDLLDEIKLLTFPIVLCHGKRFFGEDSKPGAFKLIRSSVSTTGVIMSVYHRNGDIKTGSFAMQEPSEAEIRRRERMKT